MPCGELLDGASGARLTWLVTWVMEVTGYCYRRFKSAAPEIINCRLAMVGVISGLAAEKASGLNVIQQTQSAPLAVFGAWAILIVASLVPILRGQPRTNTKGPLSNLFTPDAELYNGKYEPLARSWNANAGH